MSLTVKQKSKECKNKKLLRSGGFETGTVLADLLRVGLLHAFKSAWKKRPFKKTLWRRYAHKSYRPEFPITRTKINVSMNIEKKSCRKIILCCCSHVTTSSRQFGSRGRCKSNIFRRCFFSPLCPRSSHPTWSMKINCRAANFYFADTVIDFIFILRDTKFILVSLLSSSSSFLCGQISLSAV